MEVPAGPAPDLQQGCLYCQDSNPSFPRVLEVAITLTSCLRLLYETHVVPSIMNE